MKKELGIGVIGNGSWATALVKMLTDNQNRVNWWIRNEKSIEHIRNRRHNPNYLPSAHFDMQLLNLQNSVQETVAASDLLVIAVPSAYIESVLGPVDKKNFKGKKVLSAIKGLIPGPDVLLNEYLKRHFDVPLENYFAVLGPYHDRTGSCTAVAPVSLDKQIQNEACKNGYCALHHSFDPGLAGIKIL